MKTVIRAFSAILLTTLLLALPAVAEPTPTGTADPARMLLDKVMQAHVDLKSGEVDMTIDVVAPEYACTQTTRLLLSRPKQLYWHGHAEMKKDGKKFDVYVVTDGKTIYQYDTKKADEYFVDDLPEPIRAIDLGAYFNMGMSNLILDLMTGSPEPVLRDSALRLTQVEGKQVLELVNTQDKSVQQLFVNPETNRLDKIVAVVEGKPMATAIVSYARVGEPIAGEEFQWTPPANARPLPKTPAQPEPSK